jgi:hypothetical protein
MRMRAKAIPRIGVRPRWVDILIYAPVGVCVLLMIPRLASPQFGLLDDPWNLSVARDIVGGDWLASLSAHAVRFRPVYFLAPGLVYWLAGLRPVWYLALGAALFAGTTAALIWFVRLEGGSPLQAGITGLLFALAGPAVETYYTVLKSESLQVFFLVASLLPLARMGSRPSQGRQIGAFALSMAFALLGLGSKETSLLILPIGAAWWLIAWLRERRGEVRTLTTRRARYMQALALCLPVVLVIVGRFLLGEAPAGMYVRTYSLDARFMFTSLVRLSGWLLRDFPYLFPLLAYAGWIVLRTRRWSGGPFFWEGLVWMAGWVMVYLPWPFTNEYYLLPAAVGCSLAAGAVVGGATANLRASQGRSAAAIGLTLATLGLLATLPNNLVAGRIQLAVDRSNAAVIDSIVKEVPFGARVVVNMQEHREYFDQMEIALKLLLGRSDLDIVDLQGDLASKLVPGPAPTYLLTPSVSGIPYFAVRIGVGEAETRVWNERVQKALSVELPVAFDFRERFSWLNVNPPALLCPFFPGTVYCHEARPVLERGEFSYGWTMYRLPGESGG